MIYFFGGQFEMPTDYHTKGFSFPYPQGNTETSCCASENAIYLPALTTLRHNKLQLCVPRGVRRGEGLPLRLMNCITNSHKFRGKSFYGQCAFIIWKDASLAQIQSEAESCENYEWGEGEREEDALCELTFKRFRELHYPRTDWLLRFIGHLVCFMWKLIMKSEKTKEIVSEIARWKLRRTKRERGNIFHFLFKHLIKRIMPKTA